MSERHPFGQSQEELLEHLDAEHWNDDYRRENDPGLEDDLRIIRKANDDTPELWEAEPFAWCDRCGEPIWDAEDAVTLFFYNRPVVCTDCWHRTVGER